MKGTPAWAQTLKNISEERFEPRNLVTAMVVDTAPEN